MFLLGATGFIHELLFQPTERPWLLYLSGALMGLPVVMASDWTRRPPEPPDPEVEERWTHLP